MVSWFPGSRESSDRAVGFCLNCGPGYEEQRIGAVREAGQTLRKHLMSVGRVLPGIPGLQ